MEFFYPGKKFPSLSVTGGECALNCAHCRGHYLRNMIDVRTPKKLYTVALELADKKAHGFLLSGGSDKFGRVPLDSYFDTIGRIREETSLLINVHTGLLKESTVEGLKRASPHVVSLDLVGSKTTIREVFGLKAVPGDYEKSYRILKEASLNPVPHITVGLEGGTSRGEYRAVDMASETKLLILNSLIPSRIGHRVPERDFLEVLKYALDVTDARIYLGCMRERGRVSLEKRALKMGASGIVIPAKDTLKWARDNYDVEIVDSCCAAYL